MPETLKLALPDLVSNSYFPAIAAVDLGAFEAQGLRVELEMIYPAPACYTALRDRRVDLVAGSAHLPLGAFPRWQGVKLLCALSQGMYWFLVMRRTLGVARGDLDALCGRRIVAAPGVDLGFRALLAAAGIDPVQARIDIGPLPGGVPKGVSFGVAAARAMVAGEIDGFWANGMAAAVAMASGAASIVLDVRRGDGPPAAFGFTQPTLASRDDLLAARPDLAAAAVRAVTQVQAALRDDPGLAAKVAARRFPAEEAGLITGLMERDAEYLTPALSEPAVASMQAFACAVGLLDAPRPYTAVVAAAGGAAAST